jgi:hypothetical protein
MRHRPTDRSHAVPGTLATHTLLLETFYWLLVISLLIVYVFVGVFYLTYSTQNPHHTSVLHYAFAEDEDNALSESRPSAECPFNATYEQ